MWFFVFSINFARTREGRPARRKLTELLVKSKKTLVTEPAAIFFVFQVNISCKTTSIILYFKYASFSVVTRKKRQNTNPHPDGNFFDDRFGLGILRDGTKVLLCPDEPNQTLTWLAFLSASGITGAVITLCLILMVCLTTISSLGASAFWNAEETLGTRLCMIKYYLV